MITQLPSPHTNTLVYELEYYINVEEIEIIAKGIDSISQKFDKINLMIYSNVKGESLASFVKEFQLGIKYWNKIDKIAFIGDHKNWKTIIAVDNLFTRFNEKYFELNDIAKAWDWLDSD